MGEWTGDRCWNCGTDLQEIINAEDEGWEDEFNNHINGGCLMNADIDYSV